MNIFVRWWRGIHTLILKSTKKFELKMMESRIKIKNIVFDFLIFVEENKEP